MSQEEGVTFMKMAVIGAGKWGQAIIGRFMSKARFCLFQKTCHLGNFVCKRLLSLRPLRQSARATGRTLSACSVVCG